MTKILVIDDDNAINELIKIISDDTFQILLEIISKKSTI